jgi:hypothetical protein
MPSRPLHRGRSVPYRATKPRTWDGQGAMPLTCTDEFSAHAPSNGLYVGDRTSTGFEVREQGEATSEITFSYRIMTKRATAGTGRLEPIELPAEAGQRAAAESAPSALAPPVSLEDAEGAPPVLPEEAIPGPPSDWPDSVPGLRKSSDNAAIADAYRIATRSRLSEIREKRSATTRRPRHRSSRSPGPPPARPLPALSSSRSGRVCRRLPGRPSRRRRRRRRYPRWPTLRRSPGVPAPRLVEQRHGLSLAAILRLRCLFSSQRPFFRRPR